MGKLNRSKMVLEEGKYWCPRHGEVDAVYYVMWASPHKSCLPCLLEEEIRLGGLEAGSLWRRSDPNHQSVGVWYIPDLSDEDWDRARGLGED